MSYVVYHTASTMKKQEYRSAVHATNLMFKLNDKAGYHAYGVATLDQYETKIVKMVEKTNLMSGRKYQEASNTPLFMSPASESYWSM